MAPAYKFTYFDTRGVAEAARFLFKYGNIDFEEIRIKKEDWPPIKNNYPFGHLPVLEHNGKIIGQSISICRYLGKVVNLAGNDDWENLEIDAIVDTINDMRLKGTLPQTEQDPEKRQKLKDITLKETVPYYFSRLDAIVKKNNGYLALGRLTWADLYLISFSTNFDQFVGGDTYEKYPNLQALRKKVEALPAIKKWIEERP
ncbi:hypothetical protein Zmor_007730 [Zophobas morio]|nr:hypothetical protein Zmor_007730 [Zophobas morio]